MILGAGWIMTTAGIAAALLCASWAACGEYKVRGERNVAEPVRDGVTRLTCLDGFERAVSMKPGCVARICVWNWELSRPALRPAIARAWHALRFAKDRARILLWS
jgi:hypothetical protein